jgi:hypothetical protein
MPEPEEREMKKDKLWLIPDLRRTILLFGFIAVLPLLTVEALAQSNAPSSLSEREARLIYSRAFEVILWASPAVAVMAQVEAGQRDLGAGPYDIIYTGKSMDHRWGGITYNNQSPYWVAGFSVRDEPVVVEIPPAREDARFFGSIHDVWFLPLEDFGPAGADQGKGGRYLVLPPGYDGEVPEGYIVLRSGSYLNFIPGRTIPRDKGQKGWDAAVDYIKSLRIYPLSDASSPKPNKFIDGSQKQYRAQPMFDLSDFHLIDRLVQEEPLREHDKAMYGLLDGIGIRKGKKFDPSPEVAAILESAAKDAQAYAIEHIRTGKSFKPFWEGSGWGSFKVTSKVAATLGSYVFDDRVAHEDRMFNHFYFAGGMYKRFDATKPSSTAYLMTAKDGAGRGLDASKTYKINIAANPPMQDFWSIIAYGNESRTFINSLKFTVSSNDESVKVNDDGSIDLYLGPRPIKGFEANTVITNPDEDYFLMFRLYGAKPQLWERKWKLGDPELLN